MRNNFIRFKYINFIFDLNIIKLGRSSLFLFRIVFRWNNYPTIVFFFFLYFCFLNNFFNRFNSFLDIFIFLFLLNWLSICHRFLDFFLLSLLNWFFLLDLLCKRLNFFVIISFLFSWFIRVVIFFMIISFRNLFALFHLFNLLDFLCCHFLLFNSFFNLWFFFNFFLSLYLLFFLFWFFEIMMFFILSWLFVLLFLIFILIILILMLFVMIFIRMSELSWCISNSSPVFNQLFMLSSHFNKKSSIKYFFVIRSLYEVNCIDSHFQNNLKRSWIVIFDFNKFEVWESLFNIFLSGIEITFNEIEGDMLNILIKIFNLINKFFFIRNCKMLFFV